MLPRRTPTLGKQIRRTQDMTPNSIIANGQTSSNAMEARRRWWRGGLLVMTLTVGATLVYLYLAPEKNSLLLHWNRHKQHDMTDLYESNKEKNTFPEILKKTVYSEQDFRNEKGIVPSFWEKQDSKNYSRTQVTWGPCYPPNHAVNINWNKAMKRNETEYHPIPQRTSQLETPNDLSDYCRPGFLIIGAGKCGTSSLYHYLTSHDRVLPASEKQIHYFKYYYKYPMKWYLSHFATATSFLASGALMTGEASPGYLPYPDVAARTARMMPGTKIVAIGRSPLERAYSSYRYNYASPSIDLMRRGGVHGVKRGQSDDFYRDQYLFSFEEMLRAEWTVLRECLAPGGPGEGNTSKVFGKLYWTRDEYKRRQQHGLPQLVDLDGTCYGNKVSSTVPRKQWASLVASFPEKIVNVPSIFLVQALLGRSLYVFPLEWWYLTFPKEDICFICTEEMRDRSGEPMNQLGQFLGLPSFNFSSAVSEGMFNVGGHEGYDKEVSWENVEKEAQGQTFLTNEIGMEIPLSDEFRKELEEFIRPFNERLFELIGRRCNW